MTDQEKAEVEVALHQFAMAVQGGINALDLESQFDMFTDSPDFTFAEDGQLSPPKAAMLEMYKPIYAEFEDMSLVWDTIRVGVLCRDAGVITARAPFSFRTRDGQERGGVVVSTYAVRRNADRWELVHGHASHVWND